LKTKENFRVSKKPSVVVTLIQTNSSPYLRKRKTNRKIDRKKVSWRKGN